MPLQISLSYQYSKELLYPLSITIKSSLTHPLTRLPRLGVQRFTFIFSQASVILKKIKVLLKFKGVLLIVQNN
jgi:hypothetical protein